MSEKPGYEELLQRIQELEAANARQLSPNRALDKLFDLSLDMFCVATLDGYFRVINAAFETTLGHSRQVLLETPFIEFVHPDDVASTLEAVAQQVTGEPVSYFENRYRCKNGSYKWLAWTAVPVTDEGLIYATARDITNQKTLQDERVNQHTLLKNILSNVPASVFWKDRNSVYLGVNKRFVRDTGLQSADEIIGKTDYQLAWTREQAEAYREGDRRVMETGEALLNIEESQQQADGKLVHLLTNKAPLLDAAGQINGMLGIYIDITQRKQAEDTLRKSEARLQTLFNSAVEFIFVLDSEGLITKANRHVYEQSGYKEDEVIGSNLKAFFSDASKEIYDCQFPGLQAQGYDRTDIEFACKDGRIIQMECLATAIPDEDNGHYSTFMVVQRDVTERRRAETAMAISERRFRTIFNSSYQLIGILDPDGILLEANQTALDAGGLRQEDVAGRPFWDTYWWRYSTDVQNRLKTAIREAARGEMVRYEENVLDGERNIRTIDFTLKPVQDQQGKTVLIIPEGTDITDRKHAEEAAQRHHREMAHVIRLNTAGEMASGMAHELNQPLTALLSYCGTALSLVNSMSPSPPELGEILKRATEQAHRAGDIIRHLRTFVSKSEILRERLALDQVIADTLMLLKHDVATGNVSINFHSGCQACMLMADRIQIEQVLINMVRNSLEAIAAAEISGGQIDIKTRLLPNKLLEVTVSDNGPGINPDIINTVFHPFQSDKKSGMGIGLSLSSTIIESHGGKLWVDKHYPKGARFGFELPVSN